MITIILEAALRSFVLGALAWLALKALRIDHPHLERNAWLVVLAAALAMPLMMQIELISAATPPTLSWYPYVQMVAITAANTGPSWLDVAAELYVAITALFIARQAIGLIKAWRLRRASTPASSGSKVRICASVRSPVTVFSTIIVPADFRSWSPDQQNAALAHEAAHVANFDFYLQQLAQLHRNVFWFNPLAWWLVRRLSVLNEHISDDAALQTVTQGATYAEFLLSFA
jgi:beta-lactamase regulating signal transducer with metallopeptidase domain